MKEMPMKEFLEKMRKEGFEKWFEDDVLVEYGKTIYKDGHGDLEDWEVWDIVKITNQAVHFYGTNRHNPGWEFCTACGTWYKATKENRERHENCVFERIKLTGGTA